MSANERKRFKFVNQDKRIEKGQTEVSRAGFYNKKEWQHLRASFIRQNSLCEHCKLKGLYIAATVVDHIEPLTLDNMWTLGLQWDNLQSLCNTCHRRKTNRSKGKYSPENMKKGRALMNKFNDFNK
ncbi:HNH endonuclease [Carboxylicivirga marina]|uniref:Putative HNH nuclease YajD n=1 Tax=Carboxylicivirga marina TaxID=2800988 RepID=A0ABS1HGA5_9BACT|nr:HNH endonuclease signature motif containing protein [Carboxylicivirga marina]MBK3516698.1 HNH endonuclease [Carboxylicivirga marina]